MDDRDDDIQDFPLCQLVYFPPALFGQCEQKLVCSEGYRTVMTTNICVNCIFEIKKTIKCVVIDGFCITFFVCVNRLAKQLEGNTGKYA
jgi:hypothetical protein